MKSDNRSSDTRKNQNAKGAGNRRNLAFLVSGAAALAGCILYPFAPKLALFAFAAAIYGVLLTAINGKVQKQVNEDRKKMDAGLIQITVTASDYEWQNYRHVESVYTSLGFRNIEVISLKDLKSGLLHRPGTVKSVTVNGVKPGKDEWYPADAKVVICYHDMAEQ